MISSLTFIVPILPDGGIVGLAAARTFIGGLDLWGGATLWGSTGLESAAGLVLGAHGLVGDVEFNANMGLNAWFYRGLLGPFPWSSHTNDFDAFWHQLMLCDLLVPIDFGCEPEFSVFELFARVPLDCFDVESRVLFATLLDGFDFFLTLSISDVDLGLDGLTLDPFMILFAVDAKAVLVDLDLRLVETLCLTPYISLVSDPLEGMGVVGGLSVDALELIWNVGDVTFIASELFETDPFSRRLHMLGDDARIHTIDLLFEEPGDCFTPVEANEAIGIEVYRDGCCGALLGLGIYTFFDTDLPGTSIFDWSETRVTVEYGTAPGFTVSGHINANHKQVTSLGIAFEFLWGQLTVFGPGWGDACCEYRLFAPL